MPTPTAATSKEKSLWLLEDLVPGTGVNNLSVAFHTEGRLDLEAVRRTVDWLARRHRVLRTVFHGDGLALTKEIRPADAFRVEVESLDSAEADVLPGLTAFVARPFQRDGGPLWRARHLRRADGDVLCLALHHSVFDGMSTTILRDDFATAYDAFAAGEELPEELTTEQPLLPESTPSEKSRAFWQRQLDGFDPSTLTLGCDKPAPAQVTLAGDQVTRRLSEEATAVVKRMQRELRAPEAVVLLAAYYVLLAAHGTGRDLTVGSPLSIRGRDEQRAIGYHINVLTLRADVDPQRSFRDLVVQVRRNFLEAVGHADLPVDDLLELVPRAGAEWRNQLFRHVFNYIPDSADTEFKLGGERARLLMVENGSSKFDLEFFVTASAQALQVRAAYYVDAIDRSDVELLLERYDDLLRALAADPDSPLAGIPVWSERDLAVIEAANATDRPLADDATVLRAIAERVDRTPDAPAVVDGDRQLSYAQLWRTALDNRDRLRAVGAGPGSVVALLSRRGPELAAAVLGIWLAEATYLPLDPDHPEQRIAYQLSDSAASVVIADPGVQVPDAAARVTLTPAPADSADATGTDAVADVPAVDPLSCAYLIYTSGSTGRPKGTRLHHRGLVNLVDHFAGELAAGADDSTLWMTTFSFDISALELFLPLTTGGRLVVAPDDARTDGGRLLQVLRRHKVTIAQATPTSWRLIVAEAGASLAGVRVLCGGEPLPATLARELVAVGADLRNVYGPTETTIWSTSGRVTSADTGRIRVGSPIANTRVFLLGPDGRELPIGLGGELCIGGVGVAMGYHERPELTAERFIDHPVHGRSYRTGDLARWLPDGTLEVLGRMDRQVKLRGNRIELGEVESVLTAHPGVAAAAVVVVGDPSADGALVAFVVAPEGEAVRDGLWEHARTLLPGSAAPQDFVLVDAFPTTGNDKTDYPALTRQAEERRLHDRRTAAGRTDAATGDALVDELVALWGDLLATPTAGADTHFFTSGGHSLLGAQLLQRVEESTGTRLKLADLFAHPTPVQLAARLRGTAVAD
ncbi:amino acid adenylation domain-containing protein [Streptomyces sp. NPDC096205]|uniref:non-ribosomal peptide synthetase n=1 Tax=Streptomyces sp. NPDC096205 TaxID=3366081 RepID=UPI00382D53FC